jgi:hypothetical protein
MKIWYLQNRRGRGGKVYTSEMAYLKATYPGDNRKLFILESNGESVISGEYLQSTITQRDRDQQLSSILGDSGFISDFYELKILFENICPEKQYQFYTSKDEVSKALNLINDKKSFSTFVSNPRVRRFLLLSVSDSVEWYKALLKCHAFQSIPNDRRIVVSEQRLKNFMEAKMALRKKKK